MSEDEQCQEPCDPDLNRNCCEEYWDRMEREGFWNRENHKWTNRGWREIIK